MKSETFLSHKYDNYKWIVTGIENHVEEQSGQEILFEKSEWEVPG